MKILWKGNWKNGEISMEAETPDELIEALEKLESVEKLGPFVLSASADTQKMISVETPSIPGNVGPSEAVRQVLSSPWGKAEPRTMTEIMNALKESAIYFSKSTISGILTNMTKAGVLRRPTKKEDMWAYVLSS